MEIFGAQKQKLLRLSHCLAPALLPGVGGAAAEPGRRSVSWVCPSTRRSSGVGGRVGGSRGAPPRESRCGIQSLRALDTPPRFHDLLKPEFMASDSIGLPTPICLLGPCTPFMLPTLAPPQSPGSFASPEAFVALGRLALSAFWLLSGCVGTGGGKTRCRGAHGVGSLRSTCPPPLLTRAC